MRQLEEDRCLSLALRGQDTWHLESCLCMQWPLFTQFALASRAFYLLESCALACLSSGEQKWGTHLTSIFFFHCFKGISVEAMSESKMASSELSSGSVEKAAKPLPFKDPNFVVST